MSDETTEERAAYDAGATAAKGGEALGANPYTLDDALYEHWEDGFLDAAHDIQLAAVEDRPQPFTCHEHDAAESGNGVMLAMEPQRIYDDHGQPLVQLRASVAVDGHQLGAYLGRKDARRLAEWLTAYADWADRLPPIKP